MDGISTCIWSIDNGRTDIRLKRQLTEWVYGCYVRLTKVRLDLDRLGLVRLGYARMG